MSYVEDPFVQATLTFIFTSEQVYGAIATLLVAQACTLIVLFVSIPAEFRSTFLTTETTSQYFYNRFEAVTSDRQRDCIFTFHRSRWVLITNLKEWLNERLPHWVEESPAWFDDHAKASIPDDMVDDLELLARIRGEEIERRIQQKRRSSIDAFFSK